MIKFNVLPICGVVATGAIAFIVIRRFDVGMARLTLFRRAFIRSAGMASRAIERGMFAIERKETVH